MAVKKPSKFFDFGKESVARDSDLDLSIGDDSELFEVPILFPTAVECAVRLPSPGSGKIPRLVCSDNVVQLLSGRASFTYKRMNET